MSIATARRQAKAAKNIQVDATLNGLVTVAMIPLSKIDRDGQNHRLNHPEDKKKIRELMDDFAAGPAAQLQPVRVYERTDGTYLLGFGFRRCAAAEACYWSHIRAEVLPDPGVREEIERVRAIENLHRQDLNPMEEAVAVSQLLGTMPNTGGPPTTASIDLAAAMLGKPASWIRDRCYLQRLGPKTRKRVIEGTLLLGHAREIAKLGDHAVQERLAEMCEVREDGSCQSRLDQVRQWVANHQRTLRVVPWKLESDFSGVKDRRILGACSTCPHNSSNDHQLFEHDQAKAQDNFCLNDACYEVKMEVSNKAVEKAVASIVKKDLPANESTALNVAAEFVKPGRVAREARKQKDQSSGSPEHGQQPSSKNQDEACQTVREKLEEASEEAKVGAKYQEALDRWQGEVVSQIENAAEKDAKRVGCLALLDATDWAQNLYQHDQETIEAGTPLVELAVAADGAAAHKLAEVLRKDPRWQCSVVHDMPPELLERFALGWNLQAGKMPRLEDFQNPRDKTVEPSAQDLRIGWGDTPLTEVLREAEVSFHGLGTIKDDRDERIETLDQLCAMLARAEASGPIEDLNFKIPGTGLKISHKILTAARDWFAKRPTCIGQPVCLGGGPAATQRVIEHHRKDTDSKVENQPPPDVAHCRVCGCTEDDCSGCVKRTGASCHWVEDDQQGDLCSACADFPDEVQNYVSEQPTDLRQYALASWSCFTGSQEGKSHPKLYIPEGQEAAADQIFINLQSLARNLKVKWKKDKAQSQREKLFNQMPAGLRETFQDMPRDDQFLAAAFWANLTDRTPAAPDPDQFGAATVKKWQSIRAIVKAFVTKEGAKP